MFGEEAGRFLGFEFVFVVGCQRTKHTWLMEAKPLPQTSGFKILPRIVAIVGCDGSGKSTMAAELLEHLSQEGPSKVVYLGQSSGHIATYVDALPIIGPRIKRYLVRKAERSHDQKIKTQDLLTTVAIFVLSLWRAYKFRRMLALCRQGVFVITDRYPQDEVVGFFYDGPGLKRINTESWIARKLAARERRLYRWMARYLPALVIRLGVDADTAIARKPDHDYATLCDKVSVMQRLHFNGASILEIDSCEPSEEGLRQAMEAVDAVNNGGQVTPVEVVLPGILPDSKPGIPELVD